jgi:drug/metabolite transporter (DMT)-like permease
VRRPSTVELMLLATILLWSLNLSVTKYILDQGLEPLSYATIRYALAGAIFVVLTLLVERTLRIERRHLLVLAFASVTLWLNQVCFVLALDKTTASTIGLILGAIPIFAALFGLVLGRERLSPRFWLGAAVSFAGVGLVAVGSGGEVSGGYVGIALGLGICATWAAYSVAVAPLMATYSPSRVSAVVIPCAWVLIALVGLPQTSDQDWHLSWQVWALLVFATIGPLVLTNVFWFRSISRIGPARATLAANLQPFVAAVLAVILLSEPLGLLQVLGGLLIAAGIVVARRRPAAAQAT